MEGRAQTVFISSLNSTLYFKGDQRPIDLILQRALTGRRMAGRGAWDHGRQEAAGVLRGRCRLNVPVRLRRGRRKGQELKSTLGRLGLKVTVGNVTLSEKLNRDILLSSWEPLTLLEM